MSENMPPKTSYSLLPAHLRPEYSSSSDFRLMSRAFRMGWVRDVPAERVAEWDKDLARALGADGVTPATIAAIRAYIAAFAYFGRMRIASLEGQLNRRKRPRGRPRKRAQTED